MHPGTTPQAEKRCSKTGANFMQIPRSNVHNEVIESQNWCLSSAGNLYLGGVWQPARAAMDRTLVKNICPDILVVRLEQTLCKLLI